MIAKTLFTLEEPWVTFSRKMMGSLLWYADVGLGRGKHPDYKFGLLDLARASRKSFDTRYRKVSVKEEDLRALVHLV